LLKKRSVLPALLRGTYLQPTEQELEAAKEELVNEIVNKVMEVCAIVVQQALSVYCRSPRCKALPLCF
jgi:hypothetical protein